ncbi:hypothetical protein BDW_10755 [Bdellovibrio bacteriovorus W]|nr:hypothetical protein BDW_10755 [Bdellovibrio bacteriovorus W]
MKVTKEKEKTKKKDPSQNEDIGLNYSAKSSHFQTCYKKNFDLLIRHYTRKNQKPSQLGL